MPTSSLSGMPLTDPRFPSGGVFELETPAERGLCIEIGHGEAELRLAAGSKHLVARLGVPLANHREARLRALGFAQRALDLMSVENVAHLSITGLTHDESSFSWWTSKEYGQVLRRTTMIPFDLSILQNAPVLKAAREQITAQLSPPPPPTGPSSWHPSFRFYRKAQLSTDRVDAFRNMFLAVESLLDHVLPFAKVGMRDREWWPAALEKGLDGIDLGRKFAEGYASQIDYVAVHLYRMFRMTTFHGRASEGKLRLPLIEADEEAAELDRALSDIGHLYVVLAKKHLKATFPIGFGVFNPGFMFFTEQLLGRLSIHVTDDQAPPEPEAETVLNPRGARMFELRTRNARKLERRFERAFIGVGDVADIVAAVPVLRGLKASVGGDPFAWSDFEATLVIDGFDRFEAVMGVHGVNPTDRRRIFTT